MDEEGLLAAPTADRLRRARAGEDVAQRLEVARLAPGVTGILQVEVRGVSPVRPYNRRRGGQGLLCRVTLGDATGEVDLVLWDEETSRARGGPFCAGQWLEVAGATVRAGFQGGVELGLGAAVVRPLEADAGAAGGRWGDGPLEGILLEVGATEPAGGAGAPRFRAEVALQTARGTFRIVLWDALLQEVRRLALGDRVVLDGAVPHPALDGWFVATPGARLRNG